MQCTVLGQHVCVVHTLRMRYIYEALRRWAAPSWPNAGTGAKVINYLQ